MSILRQTELPEVVISLLWLSLADREDFINWHFGNLQEISLTNFWETDTPMNFTETDTFLELLVSDGETEFSDLNAVIRLPTTPPLEVFEVFFADANLNLTPIASFADETMLTFTAEQSGVFIVTFANALETPLAVPLAEISQNLLEIRLALGSQTFEINGVSQVLEVAPFIDPATNRTMLPLRLIAETIGATVDWDEPTRTVQVTTAAATLVIQLDTPLPDGMGNVILQDGRTFVPIRYIAENLGLSVDWNPDSGQINIAR